ncbi:MAG: peptidylprolyl isomerase [Candidatus Ratteibacteria bacterium]
MKIKIFFRRWKGIIGLFVLTFIILSLIIFLIINDIRSTVAVVNGYKIKFDEIITKIELSPEIYKEYFLIDPKAIIDDYVNQILLFQYAKKYERKLRKKVESKLKNYYMEVLTHQFVEDILSNKIEISEQEISDYYNTHLQEFVIPEKVQISEIVVDSKEKADEILNRLRMGESFEKIAEVESIAPTREKRGEIGWIEIEKLDPQVASLINQMKPGEILANIIKTEMGYHIIKLTGRTEKRILSLAEAARMIKNLLLSQKKKEEVENLLKKLKEKSKIEIYPNKIEILKGKIK